MTRYRYANTAESIRGQAEDSISYDGLSLEAMGFQLPEWGVEHPNRHPFRGVLTRLDEPSTRPPHGSDGKCVLMRRAEAEAALPTLIGMAVDVSLDFTDHSRKKIGVISEAHIEGQDLVVSGYLYAADFPKEVAYIQANKNKMGMSFELKRVLVEDVNAAVWTLKSFVFTGAAILLRDSAAYAKTSLYARAEEKDMAANIDELRAKLEKMLAAVSAALAGEKVADTATAATGESAKAADDMAAGDASVAGDHQDDKPASHDGVGDHSLETKGDPVDDKPVKAGKSKRQFMKVCRAMLDAMLEDDEMDMADDAPTDHPDEEQDIAMLRRLLQKANASRDERFEKIEAALGLITDQLEKVTGLITDRAESRDGLITDGADMKAKNTDEKDDPAKAMAQRRTLTASHQFLSKFGIEDGKDYTVPEIDAMLRNAGVLDPQTRMAVKLQLEAAGHLRVR